MDYRALKEAAQALERASEAARLSECYPHNVISRCPLQQKAAQAEVDCALALIEKSRR